MMVAVRQPEGRPPTELPLPGRPLSPREWECVFLGALDLSNKESAERLGVATQTVKNSWQVVFEKLGVTGRVGVWRALGWLVTPDMDVELAGLGERLTEAAERRSEAAAEVLLATVRRAMDPSERDAEMALHLVWALKTALNWQGERHAGGGSG